MSASGFRVEQHEIRDFPRHDAAGVTLEVEELRRAERRGPQCATRPEAAIAHEQIELVVHREARIGERRAEVGPGENQ